MQPTVISTFAGCGGSSLGYSLAGFRELLAVELDNNAVETFKLNFPDVPVYHGDIALLSSKECMQMAKIKAGALDVLDGSPPCQGFSVAGNRKFNDPRNSLFCEYVRLLKDLQPKVFVMENVPGMITGYMKQTFLLIMNTLRGCGYRAKAQIINAMYYNVPQNRQRIIIIGIRNDLDVEPSHPKPQTKPISFNNAIIEIKHNEMPPPLSPCFMKYVPFMKQGQTGADFLKGKHFQTKRIYANKVCPTITKIIGGTGFGSHIHPTEDRVLSIAEMKRCCSFPDDFKFIGSYKEQKARMGNAVMPNLMKAIAEHIKINILGY